MPHDLRARRDRRKTASASLELSQTSWLVTSLSPGSVTMSKHSISAGDGAGLLGLLARMRVKAESVAGVPVEIVVIQEAGLDGFWVHRLLEANRIKSHVGLSALSGHRYPASWTKRERGHAPPCQ